MTKPGRKTTPTALKRLRGNPGHRRLPVGEPQPGGLADVDPPAHLSRAAKAEWRRLAPELIRLGLLTVPDLPSFAAYCAAWSDFVESDRQLQRGGLVVAGKEGQQVRSPWFLIKARAVDQLVKLGDRFGFTPSARVGLASDGGRIGPAPLSPGEHSGGLAAYLAQKPDRLP
jgi:P27 family predicted phage terminase small subunit